MSLVVIRKSSLPEFVNDYVAVTSPPAGGWTWFTDPRAVEYNGTIYFTYVDGSGNVCVRTANAATLAVASATVLHATFEADDHDVPSVLLRSSDHKVLCFYCKHGGANLYYRLSSSAESIAAFGSETDISASTGKTTSFTYPCPVELTSETNSPIWLFFRDPVDANTTALRFSKSTDQASSWTASTLLYSVTNRSAYWKIVDNGADRIDFAVSDGHPYYDSTVSIGHFYYTNGSYFKTDGTSMGSPPFAFSDVSTVYSGTATSWVWDVAMDNGSPRIAYATWPTLTDARLNWARWTGSAWESHEVAKGGSKDLDPVNGHYYIGGIGIDQADPNIVYCSCETDWQYEMWRYTTADNGSSWSSEQLTHLSAGLNIRPVGVRRRAGNLAALWSYAPVYTGYLSYTAGIRGVSP